jgi:hypothetical protein
MPDKSFTGQSSLSSQGESWAELTPSNDEDLPFVPKAIHVASETGGAFTAVGADGVEADFWAVPGAFMPIRPVRILSDGFAGGLVLTGLKE